MTDSRHPLDDDALRRFFTGQLERMPRSLRAYIAQGKQGTERFMAFQVVRTMRRLGWRVDAPVRDPEGAIMRSALPPEAPDGP